MDLNEKFIIMQFGMKQRISFYKKMISLLSHGSALMRTLEKVTLAYRKRDMLKTASGKVTENIYTSLKAAKTKDLFLSDAMSRYISDTEKMLIRSGDESGDIVTGLKEALYVTESVSKIKSSVISSLTYPVVLILVLFGIYMLFALMLLPPLVGMMPPEKWPSLSQAMYTVLHGLDMYWIHIVVFVTIMISVIFYTFPRWTGESRDMVNNVFPYNLYREVTGAGFLSALSAMMASGVPMQKSLLKIRESANPFLRTHINRMLHNMTKGMSNGEVLDTGLFGKDVSVSLEVFGDSSSFSTSIKMIAEETIEATISFVNKIGGSVNLAVIIAIGCSIVFLLGGFYQIIQAIKSMAS